MSKAASSKIYHFGRKFYRPILDCIEHEYCLQLKYIPTFFSPKSQVNRVTPHIVHEADLGLLEKQCVLRVDHKPYGGSGPVVSNTVGKWNSRKTGTENGNGNLQKSLIFN